MSPVFIKLQKLSVQSLVMAFDSFQNLIFVFYANLNLIFNPISNSLFLLTLITRVVHVPGNTGVIYCRKLNYVLSTLIICTNLIFGVRILMF